MSGNPSSGTTPFPNRLLDEAMPKLRDTEWRLLCVIVRQTLGWRADDGNRRERDWLTHSQLKRRTGRASAAVSGAVDALVRKGLVEVRDGRGRDLSDRGQRRRAYARLYYRLRPGRPGGVAAGGEDEPGSAREAVGAPPLSETGNSKAKTTKESGTKVEIAQESSESEDRISGFNMSAGRPAAENPVVTVISPRNDVDVFLARFSGWHGNRCRSQEIPAQTGRELYLLRKRLDQLGLEALSARLPDFFSSRLGYVRRRGYSLESFLSTVFVAPFASMERGKPGARGEYAPPRANEGEDQSTGD